MKTRLTESILRKHYRPTDSHVLVKDCPLENGLIAKPDAYSEPVARAEVCAIGPKCHDVRVGDIVHYPMFASCQEIFPDGFSNLAEDSILLIEEGDPAVVQGMKRSTLDRSEDNSETVKYLKELNVGKLLEKKRERKIYDLGARL